MQDRIMTVLGAPAPLVAGGQVLTSANSTLPWPRFDRGATDPYLWGFGFDGADQCINLSFTSLHDGWWTPGHTVSIAYSTADPDGCWADDWGTGQEPTIFLSGTGAGTSR